MPNNKWRATLITPFKSYEKEHDNPRSATARVCFMLEKDGLPKAPSCCCCHGTYCDMHDDPKSPHYLPTALGHDETCPSCEGLKIVGDPQHGHSMRCEACNGTGKKRDTITRI